MKGLAAEIDGHGEYAISDVNVYSKAVVAIDRWSREALGSKLIDNGIFGEPSRKLAVAKLLCRADDIDPDGGRMGKVLRPIDGLDSIIQVV